MSIATINHCFYAETVKKASGRYFEGQTNNLPLTRSDKNEILQSIRTWCNYEKKNIVLHLPVLSPNFYLSRIGEKNVTEILSNRINKPVKKKNTKVGPSQLSGVHTD